VADNVRAEMARRRVRQVDLAAALGISQTATHRRVTGEIPFDVDQLAVVADLLGVTRTHLLGETETAVSA
jgi:predicted transcriptional regulator